MKQLNLFVGVLRSDAERAAAQQEFNELLFNEYEPGSPVYWRIEELAEAMRDYDRQEA